MDRTYIDINLPNIITITAIVLLGAWVWGIVKKVYAQVSGKAA